MTKPVSHNHEGCPALSEGETYSEVDDPTCETCKYIAANSEDMWGRGFSWGVVRAIQAVARDEGAWGQVGFARSFAQSAVIKAREDFMVPGIELSEVQISRLEELDK